uniref:Immunoglobulin superfamily containing leucine-rich repeat protein 2-like n=1 Tax=Poecilia latipinna TaxID=48699 RepID=A0A3B3TQ01_9TELE
MAAADILRFALWIITFLSSVLCCPESCTCSDKYRRLYAECSYRGLAKVPEGLPSNVTTVSLSANLIAMIPLGSFDNLTQVTSLWMARNNISSIEEGSLVPLVHLRNFDISHNKMADFPWGDLLNLTALEMLKMNHNELAHLPRDAFANLKNLRSLRLNNNRGEDCEVQVLFATRRRVPNLLIIISVSICLLTVSTVPLLGAMCFHLVYKYRSKTYRLILKAKDQYHLERNLNLSMHAPVRESQRKINEYEVETESVDDGEKEADTEESIVTESFTCKGNVDDCEMGSEYSDRLPLGAEAVNITSNYRYPDD